MARWALPQVARGKHQVGGDERDHDEGRGGEVAQHPAGHARRPSWQPARGTQRRPPVWTACSGTSRPWSAMRDGTVALCMSSSCNRLWNAGSGNGRRYQACSCCTTAAVPRSRSSDTVDHPAPRRPSTRGAARRRRAHHPSWPTSSPVGRYPAAGRRRTARCCATSTAPGLHPRLSPISVLVSPANRSSTTCRCCADNCASAAASARCASPASAAPSGDGAGSHTADATSSGRSRCVPGSYVGHDVMRDPEQPAETSSCCGWAERLAPA